LGILFTVEFTRHQDWKKAFESTRSMAIGFGGSIVIRILIGLIMIGLWILWAFIL
jgi:hypothetical protein